MGIEDNVFWHLTPKTIQLYFKAYRERRKTALTDLWQQGQYFAMAIASTAPPQFCKGTPPKYPEMPFKEEAEEELAHNKQWLERERFRAYQSFMAILGKHK